MLFYATPPRQAQQTCRLCTQQTLLFRFSLVYCSLSSGGFHKQHFPRYVATEIIYWRLRIWQKFQPHAVLAENCPPVLFVFYGYMMLVPCNFFARCFFLFFHFSCIACCISTFAVKLWRGTTQWLTVSLSHILFFINSNMHIFEDFSTPFCVENRFISNLVYAYNSKLSYNV